MKITIKSAVLTDGTIKTTEISINPAADPGIHAPFLPAGTCEAIRNGLLHGGIIGKEDGFALITSPALPKDADPAPLALAAAIATAASLWKDDSLKETALCIAAAGSVDPEGNAVPVDIDIEQACIATGADILYVAEGHRGYSEEGDGKCRGTLVTCLKNLSQMADVELNANEILLEKITGA